LTIKKLKYLAYLILVLASNNLLGQNQDNFIDKDSNNKSGINGYYFNSQLLMLNKLQSSIDFAYISSQDTLKRLNLRESAIEDTSKKFTMRKSPTKAVLLSLLMPGLGQVYVESYWKAPLFFAGAATLAYLIIWNNSRYLNWAHNADTISAISDPTGYQKLISINHREFYRDNRDQSAFFLLGVYILTAVDAYADSHLFDFDISQKFSYHMSIEQYNGMTLNFCYKW
jgi:hypothetical protein